MTAATPTQPHQPQATDAPLVRAHWFDGRSSKPHQVMVSLEPSGKQGPSLIVHSLQAPDSPPLRYARKEVTWPESWSATRQQEQLIVDLNDGTSLEILDTATWQKALAQSGFQTSVAQRMQTRWPVFLGVFAVAAIGLVAFYKYGTPWAAAQLTRHVPLSWETTLSAEAMQQMDGRMLKPSKLPKERQAQLRSEFESLIAKTPPSLKRYHGYEPKYTLEFRRGMGANAFALPGGAIVVTDGLVETAERAKIGDDAIIGVLAHEIGHVAHRHTTRMIVEQGVLQTGLGLALGDVSTVVATGSTLLTGLAYQRGHEREADCFAIALLKSSNMKTAPMGDLLLTMAADQKKRKSDKDDDDDDGADGNAKGKDGDKEASGSGTGTAPVAERPASAASGAGNDNSVEAERSKTGEFDEGWLSLLSTHPDTVARAQELRAGKSEHCPREP